MVKKNFIYMRWSVINFYYDECILIITERKKDCARKRTWERERERERERKRERDIHTHNSR